MLLIRLPKLLSYCTLLMLWLGTSSLFGNPYQYTTHPIRDDILLKIQETKETKNQQMGKSKNQKVPEKLAQDFYDAGMYEQAKLILSEEIMKNPKNSNLHFLLGKCFLATNDISNAQESFDRATRLDFNKGYMIGKAYLDEGLTLFKNGDIKGTTKLFSIAIKYDPSLKFQISSIFSDAAINNINAENITNAESFSRLSVSYNPDKAKTISEVAIKKANTLTTTAAKWPIILALGKLATGLNPTDSSKWGNLLFGVISEGYQAIEPKELINLGDQVLKWNSNLKDKVVTFYLSRAAQELTVKDPDSSYIITFLRAAILIDKESKDKAVTMIWSQLSKQIYDLRFIGKDRFMNLINFCVEFGMPTDVKQSVQYQFAYALKLYEDGTRERAISALKTLATGYPDSPEGKKAVEILAPPTIGRKEMNNKPLSFGGNNKVDIQLLYVDVEEDKIQISFSLHTGDKGFSLLYAPKTAMNNSMFKTYQEGIHILDDNGKKFFSTTGFIGGKQENFNSYVRKIILNPNEEIIIFTKFPMISEGATTLKFVSPQLNGWQGDWWWSEIKIKSGPFE